jgi:alpha-L-fucosidase
MTRSSPDIPPGPFRPTWDSLEQYRVPDWFRNAKFGIWAHWGPQCQPELGDWYARGMYEEGSLQYRDHLARYGHPSKAGFKDIIREWKAERWDPEALVSLYKRVGAQYFLAMANHHDNFDMWDSRHQPWNSVKMGPGKNLIAGWARAARSSGLPFGASFHSAPAWSWYEPAQGSDQEGPLAGVPYDGNLTRADGEGQWWEGLDPQDLYAQNHPRGAGIPPDEAYCQRFFDRAADLIDRYEPDLVYFDDPVLPLWPDSDVGLRLAARYYNGSIRRHHGSLEGVIFGKKLDERQRRCLVWDIGRGQANRLQPLPWQTDTCIGDWHYDRAIYEEDRYKSAQTVVRMLVDIVSKNGNLLLNIPLRGDGSVDDRELRLLEGIEAWLKVNRESIFDSRPWRIFGEGPALEGETAGQSLEEDDGPAFTGEDIRFTTRGGTLYAIALGWPGSGRLVVRSLAEGSPDRGEIRSVRLLGHPGKLTWSRERDGLTAELPEDPPGDYAYALEITGLELR